MELVSPSATAIFNIIIPKHLINNFHKPAPPYCCTSTLTFPNSLLNTQKKNHLPHYLLSYTSSSCISSLTRTNSTSKSTTSTPSTEATSSLSSTTSDYHHHHWMVLMEPPQGFNSKTEIINYYVKTLETVFGSEKDAQMCIYDASCDAHFGFCCDIDEETSRDLACVPGVLSVKPDPDSYSVRKDYTPLKTQTGTLSNSHIGITNLFPAGSSKQWLVRIDKPTVGVVTKAQMVDHYVQILTKIMGNEKDAQMCIYHISWQSNFGFCCVLDEECAGELTGVPGVLSIQPDENFESENKNYEGSLNSSEGSQTVNIKTKKLFVTGLSFYTSEKTLRAAFESFGELVEVKIIMDKISKRSKGYAFLEYTTKEAASAALKEMNNKIINGWMIVVDVAKTTPPKHSRGHPRPTV